MCGEVSDHPTSLSYTRCLYGKRPANYINLSDEALKGLPGGREFQQARSGAQNFLSFTKDLRARVISAAQAKSYLDQVYPLALEINIYHGSWNTSVAKDKDMHYDKSLYRAGIVTYPERGSMDRRLSPALGDRHAVQLVGYDDDIEVTYQKRMTDGSLKEFTRKGVYIFKNSWGTREFGRRFRYDGLRMPGLGMIPQDHVHDFGKITVIR